MKLSMIFTHYGRMLENVKNGHTHTQSIHKITQKSLIKHIFNFKYKTNPNLKG